MRISHYSVALTLATIFTLGAAPAAAQSQDASEAESDVASGESGEILVTARKREERLIDVPISMTALTSEAIQQQGITDLQRLAASTPGLSFTNTISGTGRSDRSQPQFIIRGMTPSASNTPTTTIFIDGAPFTTGQVGGLDDLERVEVLYGPQSAYFGRQVFAGAINYITRDPSKKFRATASGLGASDNFYEVRGSVEGPIFDWLSARVSVRKFHRDGTWDNEAAAGAGFGTLGDQSTRNLNVSLVAEPFEGFRLKATFMGWQDRDGPGATGLILPSQSNCVLPAGNWFCGVAPKPLPGQPSLNNIVDTPTRNWLNSLDGRLLFAPRDTYGFERDAYFANILADWEIGNSGITISSITAFGQDEINTLVDNDNVDTSGIPNPFTNVTGFGRTYFDVPFIIQARNEDFSQEVRITSSDTARFRWIVGGNWQTTQRSNALAGVLSGGNFPLRSLIDPSYRSESLGGFIGTNYDLTDKITLTAEARYQRDRGLSPLQNIDVSFKNFTPRFSVQYKFNPDVMVYATYSEGVNHAGTFNSSVLQLPEATRQALLDQFNTGVAVNPEKLTNYEIGIKGRVLDDKLTFTAALFHAIWDDQITANSVFVNVNNALVLVNVTLNNGRTVINGGEFSLNYTPVEGLDINLSGALADTEIKSGPCTICRTITGSDVVIGNQLPNTSRVQAAAAVSYVDSLGSSDWDWFMRSDVTYKGGIFATADNNVRSPDVTLVNLRGGITRGDLRFEAFAENLFNNDSFVGISAYGFNPVSTFVPRNTNALIGGLPYLRTIGVRFRVEFGG
jgi:iron complex outermembrane recepter protein